MSEATAKAFHEVYERLAPSFGYATRQESAVPWEQVPEQNRCLMIAVAGEVMREVAAEIERLRKANEHWHQRVGQLKTDLAAMIEAAEAAEGK